MALFYTYSGNVYGPASAGQTTFALTSSAGRNIPYLLPAHIHVSTSVNDQQTWVELARPADWNFDAQGTSVVLASPLPVATELRVQRITPTDEPFVDFQASSLLTAEQLNEGEEFSLYVDQELRDAVAIDLAGALIYKGAVDLTVDNAPLNPANGWTLYNTGAGVVIQGGTPGWAGIVGTTIEGGEQVIYNGAQWEIAPERPDGVVVVNGTAPITVDSTDPQRPVIGLPDATGATSGAMSAADKAKLDGIAPGAGTGTVTSIATSGAITGGTITTTGTITAREASVSQTGVVQLNNATDSTSTTQAATANAVRVAMNQANTATTNAATAQTTANTANTNAGNAQTTANTANTTANTANTTANAALARSGGTMTGGVYQTVRSIGNNSTWNMSTGNLWTFGGGTLANPSNATAGMTGVIWITGAVTGYGSNFSTNPAVAGNQVVPYYVTANNVIRLGLAVAGA